ncbi:MAG: alpha/beta hydrolase [Alphaproteobacteria bacterium]|nr:alpha/beta hydrolase [Alphaproteobacteria bacterium]
MPIISRRTGKAISDNAKQRISALRQYPTLDTFRNPLTRGIARHFAHEAWLKALNEIDFDYRMTNIEIGDVSCVQYETAETNIDNPLIVYVHGGGLVCGSPRVNAATILPVCHLTDCEAIGIDYTLLPEAAHPTQINEINSVYQTLLEKNPTRKIILLSDSAGGTLTLSALMQWRDEGVKLPVGAVFISPLVDGKGCSDTHVTLDGHDPLIRAMNGKTFRKLFQFYAPGKALDDPTVSPIYGDFRGLPPLLIHVGTREVLLGDAARASEAARQEGVETTLRLFDGMFHLFHMHWSLEEAKAAHTDIADFINTL